MKVTLADIAYDLGVSTATVSLALRDSPLVAQDTAERVRARAGEMGYVYNRRAASLRTKRSDIVGVIVRDIINPFFAEVLGAIEAEVGANKQTFLLCNHDDDKRAQDDFIETLVEFGADGVILSPAIGTTAEDVTNMERRGLPVVMVARTVENAPADVPAFTGRDREGMRLAVAHLVDLGHRDIALVGGTRRTSTGRERRAGYAEAMEAAGLDPVPRIDIEIPYWRKAGFEAAERLVADTPTAAACCSDTVALGLMAGLARHGIRPGADVAVTGYDDIEEAAIATPALTTVHDGHDEIGRLAARALYEKITGGSAEAAATVPPRLVVRESCGGGGAGTGTVDDGHHERAK